LSEDVNIKLLAAIEALHAEMRLMRQDMSALRESNVTLEQRRASDAARQAKYRSRHNNVTSNVTNATVTLPAGVVKDLDQDLKRDLKDSTANVTHVTPDSNGEHKLLVAYGTEAFSKTLDSKYPFAKGRDGKHCKDLLRDFGLMQAERIVDLACARYLAEPFHKKRGLSFGLCQHDATTLLTAQGGSPSASNGDPRRYSALTPEWKKQGASSQEEFEQWQAAARKDLEAS